MKLKVILSLLLVFTTVSIWAFSDKLPLSHVGEYRQLGQSTRFMIAESSGRVISNALEAGEEREYKWFETSDDHEIYLIAKSSRHDFPVRWEPGDWPFVYKHITVGLADGVPLRFEKVR